MQQHLERVDVLHAIQLLAAAGIMVEVVTPEEASAWVSGGRPADAAHRHIISIEMIPVHPGPVWADNDSRVTGRTVRVDDVRHGAAHCTVLTNDDESQTRIDQTGHSGPTGRYINGTWAPGDRRGTTTRIRLSRMRPIPTGYRLLTDATARPAPR